MAGMWKDEGSRGRAWRPQLSSPGGIGCHLRAICRPERSEGPCGGSFGGWQCWWFTSSTPRC